MTLTSPISHKNPTLAKVQMAQHRMRSIAPCSWALLPQARSAYDAATSAQSISGEKTGMRPWDCQGGEVTRGSWFHLIPRALPAAAEFQLCVTPLWTHRGNAMSCPAGPLEKGDILTHDQPATDESKRGNHSCFPPLCSVSISCLGLGHCGKH